MQPVARETITFFPRAFVICLIPIAEPQPAHALCPEINPSNSSSFFISIFLISFFIFAILKYPVNLFFLPYLFYYSFNHILIYVPAAQGYYEIICLYFGKRRFYFRIKRTEASR